MLRWGGAINVGRWMTDDDSGEVMMMNVVIIDKERVRNMVVRISE